MPDDIDDVVIEDSTEDGDTGTAEQKLKVLRDKLKVSQAEANDNLAGWQRAKADYVNLQKRMRDVEEDARKGGAVSVVRDIVEVFDTLEAAQKAAVAGGHDLGGLDILARQLMSALERHGVERYAPAVGDQFDPNLHEPMTAVATEDKTMDNTIHAVMQSGYALNGMTIRPARVTVFHFS
jgi:molecular chaperone GrpE